MGSRVIHYSISTILNKELKINDYQFLLGGLAPDAHKEKGDLKAASHFMGQDNYGIGYVDYHSFYNKYLTKNRTPFNLGYYFHLISDDIWLKEIYYKKIKWLPDELKDETKKMYYRDFWRLNGKLIDYYSLKLIPLRKQQIETKEIDHMLINQLIRDLETDFYMADSVKGESLEILEFTEVIQTIDITVAKCMDINLSEVSNVKGKTNFK